MDIFSDNNDLRKTIERLIGKKLNKLINIPHLGNNRSYVVTTYGEASKYFVKVYYRGNKNLKRKSAVEYQSLKYLWNNGIRSIPEPFIYDKENKIAVFEYVEGQRIDRRKLTNEDILEVISFIRSLYRLSKSEKNGYPYDASEACFSVKEITDNLSNRLNRLSFYAKENREEKLQEFLSEKLSPTFEKIKNWCKEACREKKISFRKKLPKSYRTLSPSDFGFDNCLRRKTGHLVFLDFEYFGWDDPAKMISDFLIHPRINLPDKFKKKFINETIAIFERDKKLKERLKVVFPLFGLKWCLIMLNEYLPENFERRVFAAAGSLDKKRICALQLSKAKRMLEKIKGSYTKLPY